MNLDAFMRRLKGSLDTRDLQFLSCGTKPVAADDYESVFRRVAGRMRLEERRLQEARARIETRYADFAGLPLGRQQTLLDNSSPPMLVALARDLMARSYGQRFTDLRRSLRTAELAIEVIERIKRTDHLSAESYSDLLAEAWALLGNARRINADLPGAEAALRTARRAMHLGTGDRNLKADYLSLLASLRSTQRRADSAAELVDREIALRRLLVETEKLGFALIERGRFAYWTEGLTPATCKFIRDGIELVEDASVVLLGILVLAEAFAREERGVEAVLLLANANLQLQLQESSRHEIRYSWVKGIAYRALGQLESAEDLLGLAREELIGSEEPLPAAVASIDLLAVYAEQGRFGEARELAEEAYEVFVAERLERPALAALMLLREAVQAESATGKLAGAVARFLARFQHNRNLRFEWSER